MLAIFIEKDYFLKAKPMIGLATNAPISAL